MNHIKIFNNKDFGSVIMPSKRTKILDFNQYWKYDEKSCVIYADLEIFIEKIDGCKNDVEKSSQKK